MAGGCEYVYYQFKNIFDFVKDKNNLFPHELYIAGDYATIPSKYIINGNCDYIPSDEWYANGNKSLKITCREAAWNFLRFKYDVKQEDISKTITASLKVYSNYDGFVYFNAFKNDNAVLFGNTIKYPADEETSIIFSDIEILEEWDYFAFTLNCNQSTAAIRYVDNITLNIQ